MALEKLSLLFVNVFGHYIIHIFPFMLFNIYNYFNIIHEVNEYAFPRF